MLNLSESEAGKEGKALLDQLAWEQQQAEDDKKSAPVRAAREQELADWQAKQNAENLQRTLAEYEQRAAAGDRAAADELARYRQAQAYIVQGKQLVLAELGRDIGKSIQQRTDLSPKDQERALKAPTMHDYNEIIRTAERVTPAPRHVNASDLVTGVMNDLGYVSPEPAGYWPLPGGYH